MAEGETRRREVGNEGGKKLGRCSRGKRGKGRARASGASAWKRQSGQRVLRNSSGNGWERGERAGTPREERGSPAGVWEDWLEETMPGPGQGVGGRAERGCAELDSSSTAEHTSLHRCGAQHDLAPRHAVRRALNLGLEGSPRTIFGPPANFSFSALGDFGYHDRSTS